MDPQENTPQRMHHKFIKFDYSESRMLYQGLYSLVKSNSGIGFCNCDQGHPAYAVGRNGKVDYAMFGDSPEHNTLFKMMHSLSSILSEIELDGKSEIPEYVYTWSNFCDIAYGSYLVNKNRGSTTDTENT